MEQSWLDATLRPYRGVEDAKSAREDLELTKRSEEAPMPTTVSAFKVSGRQFATT